VPTIGAGAVLVPTRRIRLHFVQVIRLLENTRAAPVRLLTGTGRAASPIRIGIKPDEARMLEGPSSTRINDSIPIEWRPTQHRGNATIARKRAAASTAST
jgi:hypothetical protein